MTKRSLGAVFGFGCLALLCLAQDSLVAAQRGGGNNAGSSGGGSRGGGSAPSSAGRSGGGGGGSHASAPSSSSSGSGFSAPRSAPSSSAPSAPRSAPSAPRYQPQPGPRSQPSEAPRYQPTPRYEQPSQPRYQPADNNPRYVPPDNSGRVYDGGRSAYQPAPGSARGPASARSEAPPSVDGRRFDGGNDGGATSREQPGSDGSWNNLTFERRAPRTPVPSLSGSDRGPGAQRFGLSERRANAAVSRSADGEGMVQIPHAPVSREAILARYSTAPTSNGPGRDNNAALRADSGRSDAGDLSRARTSLTPVRSGPTGTGPATSARSSAAPKRGSVESARRERESVDHLDRFRAKDPNSARKIDKAGEIATRATTAATRVSVGVGVTFGTGIDCGGFWDPSCNNNSCGSGSWFWFGCNGWPVWCSPGCGSSWPFGWGFSWCGSGWGLSYSSCCYSPWSYGYCYPYWGYSYPSYWCPTPAYYSSVIYQGYDEGAVYQEPVVAGEGAVDAHNQIAAPQGANAKAMGRGVSQYLSLGDEAFSQGRYSEAVNAYARAVEASPDEGVLYLILSDALFATGDYHYAAYALRRSLELDPNLLSSVVDKHNFYGEPAEFDRQIALAESYLDEHFLDDDARLVLGANYLFANRPAQASDMLQSAFSKTVRESAAGALILKRADELRAAHPLSK